MGRPATNDTINEWRHDNERAELVERIVSLTRDNQHLRRALKEVTEAGTGGEPFAAYLESLYTRIRVLEQNIDRLVSKRRKAA